MHTSCLLAYNHLFDTPKVGLHMARTMTAAYDGLNHQGGVFTTFDANTLERDHDNLWDTASHSMGNSLQVTSDAKFTGMEIGDNYPRGISVFHIKEDYNRRKNTIYQFKT